MTLIQPLIQTLTRSILIAGAAASLLTLGGCYEKVTYVRPFPGMRANGTSVPPTTHDYSNVQMVKRGSDFDPVAMLLTPFTLAAKGINAIGNGLSSGGSDNANGNNNQTNGSNNSNTPPTRTINPPRPETPTDSGGPRNSRGGSIFDTNPDN